MQGKIIRTSFLGVNMKVEILGENNFQFVAIIPQHIVLKEKLEEGIPVSYQIEELSYVNLRLGKTISKLAVAAYEI